MAGNNTTPGSSRKRAASHDDHEHIETSASKRLKNDNASITPLTPTTTPTATSTWASKTGRPAAYDEDLAPPAKPKTSQQDLKSRATKQLKSRKVGTQTATKTAAIPLPKTAAAQVSPAAHEEDNARPAAHAEYATESHDAAGAGAATDIGYAAEAGYEEQVDYGEDAYYSTGVEYAPEAGYEGAADYAATQNDYPANSDDTADYTDAAQVKVEDDGRPAAYDEDLTQLGKVHAGWETTQTPQPRKSTSTYHAPQQKAPYPPRSMYPPRPMYSPQAMFPAQAMLAAQAAWGQTSYKSNYYSPAPRPPPATTQATRSQTSSPAATPSSTATNEYGYTTQFGESSKPAVDTEPTTPASILTLLSDKAAKTSFPNPAQLKHSSLAHLDFSLSSLIDPASRFEALHTKYSNILRDSTKNEREISDLLRLARKAGQTEMVGTLEGKLVEERERMVRAEGIVGKVEGLNEEMGKVAEKVLDLDGAVWEVVRGVKEVLETDATGA